MQASIEAVEAAIGSPVARHQPMQLLAGKPRRWKLYVVLGIAAFLAWRFLPGLTKGAAVTVPTVAAERVVATSQPVGKDRSYAVPFALPVRLVYASNVVAILDVGGNIYRLGVADVAHTDFGDIAPCVLRTDSADVRIRGEVRSLTVNRSVDSILGRGGDRRDVRADRTTNAKGVSPGGVSYPSR